MAFIATGKLRVGKLYEDTPIVPAPGQDARVLQAAVSLEHMLKG